jgi:membrane protease YdiL (CAAX protease family)
MNSFNLTSSKNIFLNIWGLVILLVFILLFQIVGYGISLYVLAKGFHISIEEVKSLMMHPDGTAMAINVGRISNLIQFFFYMGIPAILFVLFNRAKFNDFGGYNQKIKGRNLLWGALIGATALPVISVIVALMKQFPWPAGIENFANKMEYGRTHLFENLLDMQTYPELIFCIFILAFMPAVLEEFVFRGIILKIGLNQFSKPRKALMFQAIVFAAMHFSFYEFPGILLMGALLGYISYKFNNLWYNTFTHFIFNGITIVIHFAILRNFEKAGVMFEIEQIFNNFFVAIPASIIFGYSIYQLTKLKNDE